MPRFLPLGPAMVSVSAVELTTRDRERLLHPLVGAVILFGGNYRNREKLARLCADIHALRDPPLLIGADQEGGRVQRFRDGFTALPPMRRLGELWDADRAAALHLAEQIGLVISVELRICGVDFSFVPVLDIDHGASTIIGNRAFHSDPAAVAELGAALISGLRQGGMSSVGKHFPGHGYVRADSHLELPTDERSLEEIVQCDLIPFERLARAGLGGMMPAHVRYPKVDAQPAGYSRVWLQEILRGRLGFDGTIFSDDLGMEGASGAGGGGDRARAAMHAGCDMVLVCNASGTDQLLAQFEWKTNEASRARLARMTGGTPEVVSSDDRRYVAAVKGVARLA